MTAITIVDTDVKIVMAPEHAKVSLPFLAGETIVAGKYIRYDPTTGYARLGNATSLTELRANSFIAGNVAGDGTIEGCQRGCILDLGDALDALDIDDPVYVADADGGLADVPGTIEYIAGYVVPGFGLTTHNLLKLTLGDPIIDVGSGS